MNSKRLIRYSFILCSLVIPMCLYANINNSFSTQNPISSVKIYTANLDLDYQDIQKLNSKEFNTYRHKNIILNQVYWFKITITNSELKEKNNFLHSYDFFSKIELFQPEEDGSFSNSVGGTYIPARKRSTLGIYNDKVAFYASTDKETIVYLKAVCKLRTTRKLSFYVVPKEKINSINFTNYIVQSIFSGVIFIICFLNFILFSFTREKLYLYYFSYIAIVALFFLSYMQITELIFFINFPILDQYLYFSLYFGMVLYALFISQILKNEKLPFFKKIIKYYIIVSAITAIVLTVIAQFDLHLGIAIGDYFSILNVIFLMPFFVILYNKVSKMVKVIFLGSQFIIVGGVVTIIADMFNYNTLNIYYYQAGFFIELLFFTVAVNYIHHKTRLEKIKALLNNSRFEANQLKKEKEANILKDEIDKGNRNLTSKGIEISQKEELIKKVINELTLLKDYRLNGSGINKIILKLKSSLHNNNWEEFETHFNMVHPRFYNLLAETYPTLSSNERKICAFLKLNLSTKEISSITGKSLNTIDVARGRLRKKMNLNHSDNMSAIIAAIS